MKNRGYFGVGCLNMKNSLNYGTLFRTAKIFNADFMFLIGKRFVKQSSDTTKSWRHIPMFEYEDFEDFNSHRPYNCQLVGIELMETAISLNKFTHPQRACYLLGAEDNGLTEEAIKACQHIVVLPGNESLNVSVAGSIVLYDRITRFL